MTTSSKTLRFVSGLLLSIGGVFSAHAQVTNTMTNIVTVADACDIVAIGLDFGVVTAANDTIVPFVAAGSGNVPGNAAAGNSGSGHPHAGYDGSGAINVGEDDDLTLNVGVGALQTAVDTVLSTAIGTGLIPGVYVACTLAPSSITLESEDGGSFPLTGASVVFDGTMYGRDNGGTATTTDLITYELTLTSTDPGDLSSVTGTLAGFNVVIYAVSAAAITELGTLVTGFYTDFATATVNF